MSKAKDLRGREKAAILLVALGPEVSSMVYKHLDDATIELLTLEIANMRRITPDTKLEVLKEAQEVIMAREFMKNRFAVDHRRLLAVDVSEQVAQAKRDTHSLRFG